MLDRCELSCLPSLRRRITRLLSGTPGVLGSEATVFRVAICRVAAVPLDEWRSFLACVVPSACESSQFSRAQAYCALVWTCRCGSAAANSAPRRGGPSLSNYVWIAVTFALVTLLNVAVVLVRRGRRDRRRIKKVLSAESRGGNDEPPVRLAAARSAYERGDYERVCTIVTDKQGAMYRDASLAESLLLAAACDQLDGFEASAAAFQAAVAKLPEDQASRDSAIEALPLWDQRMIAKLARRLPDLATGIVIPADLEEQAQESDRAASTLAELRYKVDQERVEAETKSTRYQWINVGLGGMSAAAAAGAGLSGALKSWPWVIVALSLLSAAISTTLITLKPAETAEAEKKTAEALDDLVAEIDLFDTGKHTDAEIGYAEQEVQSRFRLAKNRPRPSPLTKPLPLKDESQPAGGAPDGDGVGAESPPAAKSVKRLTTRSSETSEMPVGS